MQLYAHVHTHTYALLIKRLALDRIILLSFRKLSVTTSIRQDYLREWLAAFGS